MRIPSNATSLARYVGTPVLVSRPEIRSSGIRATRYVGLLVKVTRGKAYVLGPDNTTARPFVLPTSFTFTTL